MPSLMSWNDELRVGWNLAWDGLAECGSGLHVAKPAKKPRDITTNTRGDAIAGTKCRRERVWRG